MQATKKQPKVSKLVLSLLLLLGLNACGSDDKGYETSEPPQAIEIVEPPMSEESKEDSLEKMDVTAFLVKPGQEIPLCSETNEGALIFIMEYKTFQYCDTAVGWTNIDLKGADGKDGKDGVNGKDGEKGKDGTNGSDGAPGLKISKVFWYQKHSHTLLDGLIEENAFTDRFLVFISDVRLVYFEDGSYNLSVSGYTLDDIGADNLNADVYSDNFNHNFIGKASDDMVLHSVKMFDYAGTTVTYSVGPMADPSLTVSKDDDGIISDNQWYTINIIEE